MAVMIFILLILYLLAIMPRMTNKPDITPFMGVLYAHRGLYDNKSEAPENSMKAFEKAVEAGYGIECDVQLTKDKIPVIFHDYKLNRVCGIEGRVCDYNYKDLQKFRLCHSGESIPKLKEFLNMVDGRVPIIVELKTESMDISVCPYVNKILKDYKGAYCIESFNPLVLLWYRKKQNGIMRGQLADAFLQEKGMKGFLYFALEHMLLNFITKPDFIAYNHKYYWTLSRQICRKVYRNLSVAWTITSQEELVSRRKDFDLFIFEKFIPNHF